MSVIPKIMRHIWLGPKPPPIKWMESWNRLHTDWEYSIFNEESISYYNFINKERIHYCLEHKLYTAAADIIRYEVLYADGGFLPPADSLCMENTDELFVGDFGDMAYVVYEGESVRPHMFCPVYASTPNHSFLRILIDDILTIPMEKLSTPYTSVGNFLVSKHLYKKDVPNITKFPSHYFVPNHFMGKRYNGDGKVYAIQMWGSTLGNYHLGI